MQLIKAICASIAEAIWPVTDLPGDLCPVPPENCPGRGVNTQKSHVKANAN